jgi:hypothetical protein
MNHSIYIFFISFFLVLYEHSDAYSNQYGF